MKAHACFFVCLVLPIFASYPQLEKNPYLTKTMKQKITLYLLPENHPIRPTLDTLFAKIQTIENLETLIQNHFTILSVQEKSHVVVAKHPQLKGFLFKIYRNSLPNGRNHTIGWESLVLRCKHQRKVKHLLLKKEIRYFEVPEKWLYPLHVSRKTDQPIVLIATDMDLTSHEESIHAWKTKITKNHLSELYLILKKGYSSVHVTYNIPYTKRGTFALIDLEKPRKSHKLHRIERFLSDENQYYWQLITHS